MAPLRYISGVKPKPSSGATPSTSSSSSSRGQAQQSTSGTSLRRAGLPLPGATAVNGAQQDDRRLSEFSSASDVCPVCKTDRYLQPKLRLMVSSCYHKMCESCVDRIFGMGPEPCPVCGEKTRKNAFKPQIFENLGVQKEVNVRSRVARIFNKREDEFGGDLEAYNNYLEEAEAIIFNLSTSKDLAVVEEQLRAYESQHRAQIESSLSLEDEEKKALREREDEERRLKELQREGWQKLDEEDRQQKEAEKQRILEGLESSQASASSILKAAKKSSLLRSSARSALTSTSTLPLPFFPTLPTHKAVQLAPIDVELDYYDSLFDLNDSYDHDYAAQDGPVAPGKEEGGWRRQDGWERAIREAVMGLWLPPLVGTAPELIVIE